MTSGARAGRLIVLEGIDGSGTTTQAALLAESLRARGHSVVETREPTKGPIGVLIRQALTGALVAPGGAVLPPLSPYAMALLFAADRADHQERLILPALSSGAVVISDRYTLSSLIYQSATAPEGEALLGWLQQINRTAVVPDLTLVLDLDADRAGERRHSRGGAAELYEQDELQRRLGRAYERAESFVPGQRLEHVDGAGTIAEVAARVYERVGACLVG